MTIAISSDTTIYFRAQDRSPRAQGFILEQSEKTQVMARAEQDAVVVFIIQTELCRWRYRRHAAAFENAIIPVFAVIWLSIHA